MSVVPSAPRLAVVGVSTLIGRAVIEELEARKFPFAALHALEDERGLGTAIELNDKPLVVNNIDSFDFSSVDLVFFCGRAALSERYAKEAAAHAWVIDNSSQFRSEAQIPLVAADVNPEALEKMGRSGLIALPGSASVALASALAPLRELGTMARVEVMTCHAVSGSGRSAVDELAGETVAMLSGKTARGKAFGRQIAFNVIPQVDTLGADGVSREELRLWEETKSVLGLPNLAINVTSVRVPVFFGHSLAVHVSFERAVDTAKALTLLQRGKGLSVIETNSPEQFPTPAVFATTPDKVYVGRVRADLTRDRGLNFWLVADNVRKCAAHNAVSVAQILVNRTQ